MDVRCMFLVAYLCTFCTFMIRVLLADRSQDVALHILINCSSQNLLPVLPDVPGIICDVLELIHFDMQKRCHMAKRLKM